jgi:hypothetical protein
MFVLKPHVNKEVNNQCRRKFGNGYSEGVSSFHN